MKWVLSIWVLLLLPIAVLADGKVIPPVAFPTKVTIPDQRALIQYTNGTERLVIETRFTGEGTNFAWVVPLPSTPLIEEATTGLFPTLQYLFRPQITHSMPRYYLGILATLGVLILLRFAARSGWTAFLFCLLLLLFLALLFLPALGTASKSADMSSSPTAGVSILNHQIVGIFETTTIASRDSKAIETWLRENGFVLSTNAAPVFENYVKDGWIFVASKIARARPEHATSAPHPLSFTFKTDKPVYPMRLTGVDNGLVTVELYVFGPTQAKAAHFKVERCTRPNYPEPPPNDNWSWNWSRWSPETPNVVHPLLRKWVAGSAVATKLTATLSPERMREDVWLNWTPYLEKRNRLFSYSGALTTALNWGTGFFAVGVFASWLFAMGSDSRRLKIGHWQRNVTILSVMLCCLIYLFLPKTEVRLLNRFSSYPEKKLIVLHDSLFEGKPVSRVRISAAARQLLANPKNDMRWKDVASWLNDLDNDFLGGSIREEDSPGNFILRESENTLEFVTFDAQGAEHVWRHIWMDPVPP